MQRRPVCSCQKASRLACPRASPCPPNPTQVLHENGFLYDSTLMENSNSITDSMSNRLWPCELPPLPAASAFWGAVELGPAGRVAKLLGPCLALCSRALAWQSPPPHACADTLDFGIPQNCGYYSPSQTCNTGEKYPGMWEVPRERRRR